MSSIATRLELHDHRRRQGIPTLSVLVGDTDVGRRLWKSRNDTLVEAPAPELPSRWLGTVLGSEAWWYWLSRQGALSTVHSPEAMTRLRAKGAPELTAFMQDCDSLAVGLPRNLLADLAEKLLRPQEIIPWTASLSGNLTRTLIGVTATVSERLPGMLIDLSRLRPSLWEGELRSVTEVITANPLAPAGLLCHKAPLEEYLAASNTRQQALLKEGRVDLDPKARSGRAPGVIRSVVEALTDDEVARAAYDRAAIAHQQVRGVANDGMAEVSPQAESEARGQARSAAEEFLFRMLDALPETAGRFELNVLLELPGQPRQREIDLLDRRNKIAIEIDGYFHFQDSEAYRRDRRKDVALQRGGYFVLRFLAEDVVEKLETVLATIHEMLPAYRKDTALTTQ